MQSNKREYNSFAKSFFDRYGLQLLAIPSQKVNPGDLYVFDGERFFHHANIENLFEPPLEFGPISLEAMPDILYETSAYYGLKYLETFLQGFEINRTSTMSMLQTLYDSKALEFLSLKFKSIQRSKLDPLFLERQFFKHRLIERGPFNNPESKYYFVSSVVSLSSIGITGEDYYKKPLKLELKISQVMNLPVKIAIQQTSESEINLDCSFHIAFGMELYELRLNVDEKTVRFDRIKKTFRLRGEGSPRVRETLSPKFLEVPLG